MVAKAQKNMANAELSGIIEIKESKASHIPFADSTFDTVVSTGSVYHWENPIEGLNEIFRVLKHGGYALIYDVVSDTPVSILKATAHEFGRLKMLLLWLHAFEEPFYSRKNFELLARPTLFKEGRTQFVGVLCCLILKKEILRT
jgi:ubiquinone/menaquinone biosynthesis C-methylase UbiE